MASKKLMLDCRKETGEGQETASGDWNELPQEVLNMIFDHLPVADLLSSSVVSKNWKKASRDVLKRSRECYACIMDFPQDLQDLNDMIASSDLMQLINGLHIKIGPKINSQRAALASAWRQDFYCLHAENIHQSEETRRKLEKAKGKVHAVLCGQWRCLNLDMGYSWKQNLSIDDALLLRELISTISESVQKLVVGQEEDSYFILCCGKEFSKLKVLHAEHTDMVKASCLEQLVLKCAPNLEEITGVMAHVEVHSPWNPFILKHLKNILVAPDAVIPEAGLMEGFRSVSSLHRLNLQYYHCSSSDDVSILLSMVLNSMNTLEELHMFTLEFYDLFKTSDELNFPNLRQLSLATHWRMPIEHEILALKRLNLTKLCPNLENVELSLDECHGDYEGEVEILSEGPHMVKHSHLPLQIEFECRDELHHHEYFKFLNQMYTKMNKVEIRKLRPVENSEMNSIFSDLDSLEYLKISVSPRFYDYYDPDVAIAAILCGINIEEAKFLFRALSRTNNAELNPYIVPIYPSIFNAKNLKELNITGEGNYSGAFVNHSWIINVIENLPVRHVRKLKVNFEGKEGLYKELNDLRALTTLLCAQVEKN